jgi:hypothetical protein
MTGSSERNVVNMTSIKSLWGAHTEHVIRNQQISNHLLQAGKTSLPLVFNLELRMTDPHFLPEYTDLQVI